MSDVPEGYKQTEVGIVPIEWDEKKFNDIVFDFRGGAPLTPNDFKDDGIKVLPKGGVTRGGILVIEKDKMQYCSSQYAENHKTNFVDNTYTIIVLRDLVPSGPNIGLMVKIDSNDNFILAQGVYGFKVKDELVSSHFLIHLSNGTEYRKLMNNIMVGSTQVHITNTTFLKLQIPLPPLLEQQSIASALSDLDALIAALEQLITKKRNIKQGAMQQLLTGEKRLPGFGGAWEVKKLGEIANFYSGGTPSTSNSAYYGGNIAWITSSDLNKKIILSVEGRITQKGLENSSAKMVEENTLLIALYGATAAVIAITRVKAAINQAVLAIMPQEHDMQYIYYKISSLKTWIINTYTQGGQPNLSGNIVKSIALSLPPFPEQQAIAQILTDMDAEIEALEQKQAKYNAVKQGMMQELLTGKTRLV